MMPTGLVPRAIDKGRNVLVHGPDYSSLAIMGLVIAYGLSVALEYLALRWIYQRKAWRSLFLTTWIANTVSYAAWFAVFFVIDSR